MGTAVRVHAQQIQMNLTQWRALCANHPHRPFLKVAFPVSCLDVIGMIISPCSSHPFRVFVLGHNVVEIREWFAANSAVIFLLDDFPFQQLLHFRR